MTGTSAWNCSRTPGGKKNGRTAWIEEEEEEEEEQEPTEHPCLAGTRRVVLRTEGFGQVEGSMFNATRWSMVDGVPEGSTCIHHPASTSLTIQEIQKHSFLPILEMLKRYLLEAIFGNPESRFGIIRKTWL